MRISDWSSDVCSSDLLGTLYPIVAEALGERISVGPPYYNKVAGPLALTLCLVMVAGPLLRWRRDDGRTLWTRLPLAFFAGAVVLFALVLFGGMIGILPLLGMTVAAIVAVASLAPLWKRNLRRVPLPTWGMVIAHFGVAVALAGMAAESAFIKERLVAAAPRSEEHTSELQSLMRISYAVFCLKKKIHKNETLDTTYH